MFIFSDTRFLFAQVGQMWVKYPMEEVTYFELTGTPIGTCTTDEMVAEMEDAFADTASVDFHLYTVKYWNPDAPFRYKTVSRKRLFCCLFERTERAFCERRSLSHTQATWPYPNQPCFYVDEYDPCPHLALGPFIRRELYLNKDCTIPIEKPQTYCLLNK